MPRKTKRTMSGEPGQPARTPVGAVYGEGERALESQRRMPVPDRAGPAAEIGGGGGESSGGAPATFANALAQAQAMAPPEPVMGAPTRRPGEDLTRGMAGGEAPIGPRPIVNEALYELRAIAQQHPYADFMAWLERIERGG
jgi:hypothetical protein